MAALVPSEEHSKVGTQFRFSRSRRRRMVAALLRPYAIFFLRGIGGSALSGRATPLAGAGNPVERPPSAIGFMFRIKMKHYSCDFVPVGTFRIRVEQAQIRDEVLLVVSCQYGIVGRGIGYIGIKRRLLHGRSPHPLFIHPPLPSPPPPPPPPPP